MYCVTASVEMDVVLIEQVRPHRLSAASKNRRSPGSQQQLLVYVRMFVDVPRRDGKLIAQTGELWRFALAQAAGYASFSMSESGTLCISRHGRAAHTVG